MLPGKAIDRVIASGLTGLLKQAGFRKSARTFRRSREGAIQVLNVQGSQGNGPCARFTINLGVYRADVALLAPFLPVTDQPKEYECVVRARIGALMPCREDRWWDAQEPSSAAKASISSEIAEAVECYGLPWLDAHVTLEAIRESLSAFPSLNAAAAAAAAGDLMGAREIADALASARPQSSAMVSAWLNRLLAR